MNIWISVLLGFVQGVTEFLPVSSSGHLVLVQHFLQIDIEGGYKFFDLLLHLGTVVAVLVAFWEDIKELIVEFFQMAKDGFKIKGIANRKFIVMILISMLPLVFVFAINDYLDVLFESPKIVGFGLIATALLLYFCDKVKQGNKTADNASLLHGLFVGAMQCIAVLPGLSRSGATITAGVFSGFKREFAVKFAFIMSIPVIIGANIVSIPSAIAEMENMSVLPTYIIGMAVATVSGYFSIKLIKYLSTKSGFKWFALYCLAIGVITLVVTF